jgi:capsular exopolysaccharide synthesis family protein
MQGMAEASPQDGSLTLMGLWKMVSRRRWLVAMIAATMVGAVIAYCVLATRQYTATAEIQIQMDSPQALGLGAIAGGSGSDMSDVLDASRALQTQAKILESETLALEVVKQLKLEQHPDFQPRFDPVGKLMALVTPKGTVDPAGAPLDEAPARREAISKVFKKNTLVKPVAGTRLIDVSYTSSDPHVAAATVNQLVDDLVDYNFETRFKASTQASEWIGKQLSDLRGNSAKLQAKVADMQGESGVYSFGSAAGSKGPGYSTVLDQLQQATSNLTQAESNRVLRGAMYEAAKAGDPETIAGINSSMAASGQTSPVGNSLSLIQTLRDQEATAKAQLSEMSAKFGSDYPKLEELRANVASLNQSIRTEQDRLLDQTHGDFVVAQQVEAQMREVFNNQKRQAQSLNSKAVEYEIVHQEADESRGLYERLLTRLKEAGVLEGMKPSNISLVEPGRVPAKPAKPNVPVYLAAALGGGLFLGLLSALLLEVMDSKVRDANLMGDYFGEGLVAELPFERRSQPRRGSILVPGQAPIFTLAHPASPFSEALRSLRTSILLSVTRGEHRVILITSSISAEGKTTLATNLATSLAQHGKRVLLIDADLRNPRLHTIFDIGNSFGLGNVLADDGQEAEAIHAMQPINGITGLTVLPAGTISGHPSEVLGSERMERFIRVCKEHFDFVVLDGEPILPVTDSIVLSPMADQVLLVARHGITERSMFEKSLRIVMSSSPQASMGVVINAIKAQSADQSQRYHNSYSRMPVLGGM